VLTEASSAGFSNFMNQYDPEYAALLKRKQQGNVMAPMRPQDGVDIMPLKTPEFVLLPQVQMEQPDDPSAAGNHTRQLMEFLTKPKAAGAAGAMPQTKGGIA
jgi:hypothetical protein